MHPLSQSTQQTKAHLTHCTTKTRNSQRTFYHTHHGSTQCGDTYGTMLPAYLDISYVSELCWTLMSYFLTHHLPDSQLLWPDTGTGVFLFCYVSWSSLNSTVCRITVVSPRLYRMFEINCLFWYLHPKCFGDHTRGIVPAYVLHISHCGLFRPRRTSKYHMVGSLRPWYSWKPC